ncbi:YbaB/EbfC family nucleoid-associated protein [Actinoallomurus sp. NPDC050550]|uniref:YbaB/EbfC family nucleoid-associated protein n=1 Tax=Actinoallomurus sp. NPDC050550 TaxID=3154937 RepID=UPI0033F40B27
MDLNEDMAARIAEQRERLAAVKAGVVRARAELSEASTTVRSKDHSVEVTVGSQGELKRVKFLEEKYRTMEATQLSAAIVEAATKGRAVMADRVKEAFSSVRQRDSGLPGFTLDLEELFGSAQEANGRRDPRPGRALHDEIVEDDGDV